MSAPLHAPPPGGATDTHGPLLAVAERILGSRDLAWDALQEAYVCLWQQAHTPPDVDAWLTHAVVHRSLHARRTLQRRAVNERRAGVWRCGRPAEDPTRACEERELRAHLGRAVAALPSELRAAVALQADGLDYAAIAARLGVPVGTVRSRLHRARARLAAALTPPSAA